MTKKKVVEGKVNDLFDPAEKIVELDTTDNNSAYEKLQRSSLRMYLQERKTNLLI
ncbi:MAG: hypothetical protein WDO16_26160 [Bacteroidota bacterium]